VPYLRDFGWNSKYDTDSASLAVVFYVPALQCAERYDRSTGFFAASALTYAARGIEGLVRNNGRMRLVVGCTIEQPEAEAIQAGVDLRQAVEQHVRAIPLNPEHPEQSDALELLAWMVARGYLDVKVAVPCDASRRPIATAGIFHEKAGIVEDRRGDRLAFNGSINETWSAWSGNNWESFHVFTDWDSRKHVDDEDRSFAELWNDKKKHCRVVELPDAVKDDLLRFLPSSDQQIPKRLMDSAIQIEAQPMALPSSLTASLDELRSEVWRFIGAAPRMANGGCYVGERTSIVEPWPHQVRAFHRLYDQWPPRLLVADEVGLGKTIEAGLVLRQAVLEGRAKRVLILAPKAVLTQWQIELREKFNLNWPIYDGHSFALYPAPSLNGASERKIGRDIWHQEPFVITSSQLMRRPDRASELLLAEDWDLILLDEAHHARRRGFGVKSKGPNQLLSLMQHLRLKSRGLVLLTATPMQVDPTEVWDLLSLLGMPKEWTEGEFAEFFERAGRQNPSDADLERMASLFRSAEQAYGEVSIEGARRFVEGGSSLRSTKILKALRDPATTTRRMLNLSDRAIAVKVMVSSTPVSRLVSRHTRELLRRYFKAGKIRTRIADRDVRDLFVPLTVDERRMYERVETYISTTFNQASAKEKNAVGFVMTIYRRRLASSFRALRETLEKRLAGMTAGKLQTSKEDVDDQTDLFNQLDLMDEDEAARLERETLALEEKVDIADLVAEICKLPTDTKAQFVLDVIRDLRRDDYHQVIVFTQYTDTLDFLRDLLVEELGLAVLCYSGRGGEIRGRDGRWNRISRDHAKQIFRRGATQQGEADVLLCTDAASEGLNFQFCGALINYDMPWNPMRVEQRIGRIDRLGQEYETIRIVNLHYDDTVETDVYRALRERIQLFAKFVGKLQPILAKVPQQISEAVLRGPADEKERERRRLQIASDIAAEQRKIEQQAFDLDSITEGDIEEPKRPDAPYSLDDLRRLMTIPELLPPEIEISDHAMKYATLRMADLGRAVRVTADAEFFDEHPESNELWSPGSRVFPTPPADAQPSNVKRLADLLDEAEAALSSGGSTVSI
jgi:SNF2 family DNA or RNA helicase